jgi:DNA-binding Lrp family transcriptional regulator
MNVVVEASILDEIDRKIVRFIQDDPSITYTKIAKRVNRSQPTVGMRIKKLEELGIIKFQAGLDLKNSNCYLAKVSFQTSDPNGVKEIIESCPYMIHGYRISGLKNFVIIIAYSNLKDLDKIVNYHFRNNTTIKNVDTEIISEIINEFVIPIDLELKSCRCLKQST